MKKVNILFLIIFVLIIFGGGIKPYLSQNQNNYRENRTAYQIPQFSVKSFLNGDFQNNYELALADQLPLTSIMKLVEKTIALEEKNIYFSFQDQGYHYLDNGIYLYKNNLVYNTYSFDNIKAKLDAKIENYDNILKDKNNIYLYYIEKDTDIDFTNNAKLNAYEYIKDNINSNIKTQKFTINNFTEFQDYFYKTDHHWNYKGSYKAYLDLVNLLNLSEPIKYQKEICLNSRVSGSKNTLIGGSLIFRENLCYYDFANLNYDVYINDKLQQSYTNKQEIIKNNPSKTTYAEFYGMDYGLIEFDYHHPERENLLIIGESYDNAINDLISSHFNKTYNVDLRKFETEMGYKFDFNNFITANDIDKVLLIGNIDYFTSDAFML